MKLILEKIPYRISESIHSVNWHWSEIACPYHYHSEVELVWIKKSRGRFTIGDYQGEFEKGDMYLIGSNIPHVFYNNKDHIPRSDSANLVVIQFSELFLGQQAWRIPELLLIGNALHLAKNGMQLKPIASGKMAKLIDVFLTETPATRISLLIQILEIWSLEVNRKILQNATSSRPISSDGKLQKLLQFLSENLEEKITLATLSKMVHLTPTSLCRWFKEKMGISLMDYLLTQRIALSCQFLAQTEKSILDVSYQCGFENLSNFNRQFLKRKKCSPSHYRKFYHGL